MKVLQIVWVVSLTGSCLSGCNPGEDATSSTEGSVHSSIIHPNAQSVAAVGYIEPKGEVRKLAFTVSGMISQIQSNRGLAVKKGSVLAVLQHAEMDAEVQVCRSALELARAKLALLKEGAHPDMISTAERELELASNQLTFAKKDLDRENKLLKTGASTAVKVQDYEEAVERLTREQAIAKSKLKALRNEVRPSEIKVAESQVELEQSNLELAIKRSELYTLSAKENGKILEVFHREGEVVTPGQAVLLFANDQSQTVRAEIDERYAASVQVGQKAIIYGRNIGNKEIEGKVVEIKGVMGDKTIFTQKAVERIDTDVLQIFIDLPQKTSFPVGLRVDVRVLVDDTGMRTIN